MNERCSTSSPYYVQICVIVCFTNATLLLLKFLREIDFSWLEVWEKNCRICTLWFDLLDSLISRKFFPVQCGKTSNSLSPKNISSNQVFSNLFSKTVTFMKFLPLKTWERISVISTLWPSKPGQKGFFCHSDFTWNQFWRM